MNELQLQSLRAARALFAQARTENAHRPEVLRHQAEKLLHEVIDFEDILRIEDARQSFQPPS